MFFVISSETLLLLYTKRLRIMKTFENTVVQFNNEQELRQIESYYNLVVIGSTNSGYVECWGDFDVLKGAHKSFKVITFQQWKEEAGYKALNECYKYDEHADGVFIGNKEIASLIDSGHVKIIVDSLNTYNQCQTLPSELLRQRDELLKACIDSLSKLEEANHRPDLDWTRGNLRMLIKSITDNNYGIRGN